MGIPKGSWKASFLLSLKDIGNIKYKIDIYYSASKIKGTQTCFKIHPQILTSLRFRGFKFDYDQTHSERLKQFIFNQNYKP